MGAEKSHRQHLQSQRPRKAGGAVQSEFKGLKTRTTKGKRRLMLQINWAGKADLFLSLPLCSIQALNRLGDAHPPRGGQTNLLSPLTQILI